MQSQKINWAGSFGVRKQTKRKYTVTSLWLDINHVLNKMIGECLLQDFGLSEVYFLWPKPKQEIHRKEGKKSKTIATLLRLEETPNIARVFIIWGFVLMKHSSFLAILIVFVISVRFFFNLSFFHSVSLPSQCTLMVNEVKREIRYDTMCFLNEHASCKQWQWQQIVWREKIGLHFSCRM